MLLGKKLISANFLKYFFVITSFHFTDHDLGSLLSCGSKDKQSENIVIGKKEATQTRNSLESVTLPCPPDCTKFVSWNKC